MIVKVFCINVKEGFDKNILFVEVNLKVNLERVKIRKCVIFLNYDWRGKMKLLIGFLGDC